MPVTPIQAVDERVMPFAPEQIWAVLVDARSFPDWYPPSVKVTVLNVTTAIVGSEFQIRPQGGRAFRCRVDQVDAPIKMRMHYPGEFIVGHGEWRLNPVSQGTRVTYEIDVVANGCVAKFLGWVLPLARFHSKAMGEILARLEHETARRTRNPQV